MLIEMPENISALVGIATWVVVMLAGLYLWNKGNKSREEVVRESLPWIGGVMTLVGVVNTGMLLVVEYIL